MSEQSIIDILNQLLPTRYHDGASRDLISLLRQESDAGVFRAQWEFAVLQALILQVEEQRSLPSACEAAEAIGAWLKACCAPRQCQGLPVCFTMAAASSRYCAQHACSVEGCGDPRWRAFSLCESHVRQA